MLAESLGKQEPGWYREVELFPSSLIGMEVFCLSLPSDQRILLKYWSFYVQIRIIKIGRQSNGIGCA